MDKHMPLGHYARRLRDEGKSYSAWKQAVVFLLKCAKLSGLLDYSIYFTAR
jgi:hypothetical protein